MYVISKWSTSQAAIVEPSLTIWTQTTTSQIGAGDPAGRQIFYRVCSNFFGHFREKKREKKKGERKEKGKGRRKKEREEDSQ